MDRPFVFFTTNDSVEHLLMAEALARSIALNWPTKMALNLVNVTTDLDSFADIPNLEIRHFTVTDNMKTHKAAQASHLRAMLALHYLQIYPLVMYIDVDTIVRDARLDELNRQFTDHDFAFCAETTIAPAGRLLASLLLFRSSPVVLAFVARWAELLLPEQHWEADELTLMSAYIEFADQLRTRRWQREMMPQKGFPPHVTLWTGTGAQRLDKTWWDEVNTYLRIRFDRVDRAFDHH